MSLKGRIKNYAKSNNIAAQVVLQNYMFCEIDMKDDVVFTVKSIEPIRKDDIWRVLCSSRCSI
jgi:transcription antitermination factor NusG